MSSNNKTEETKILSPTIDVVFQALFGEVGSEDITKRFLEQILGEKIISIDLSQNVVLRREKINDKMGVLDVIAKINDKDYVNIEMQVTNQEAIMERMLYYWARKYTQQMKKSNDYTNLQKTIVVLIANFNIKQLNGLEFHTKWKIIEEKHRKNILTNRFEMHIIGLEKARKEKNVDNELIDWLEFITNPESERIKEKMAENKELKNAYTKLKEMSEDEKMQRIAEWRQDAIYTENTLYSSGLKEGEKRGKAIGEEIGEKRGKEIGKAIGEKSKQIEIARNMIKEKIDIELISKTTGLTKEEIEKLKQWK